MIVCGTLRCRRPALRVRGSEPQVPALCTLCSLRSRVQHRRNLRVPLASLPTVVPPLPPTRGTAWAAEADLRSIDRRHRQRLVRNQPNGTVRDAELCHLESCILRRHRGCDARGPRRGRRRGNTASGWHHRDGRVFRHNGNSARLPGLGARLRYPLGAWQDLQHDGEKLPCSRPRHWRRRNSNQW